jgi:hypothetical protein
MKKSRTDCERNVDARPQIVAHLRRLCERMTDVKRTEPVLAHDHGRLKHFGQAAQLSLSAEYATTNEDSRIASAHEQRRRAGDCFGLGLRRCRRRGRRRCGL